MTNIDLSNYKNLYLDTSRGYLVSIQKNLELLKNKPDDKKIIYELFRLFHSLKSQNFFMGYEKTARLCKLFEDYFHTINDGLKKHSENSYDLAVSALKILETSLMSIEKNNSELDLGSDIINFESKLKKL